jgi:GMP synthase (glutamine-hydrolysing)
MIIILDCGSTKVPEIEKMVYEFMDFTTVKLMDFNRSDFPDALGFIISGAPILITEVDLEPYINQVMWIKSEPKPVLGICFGHQLMGLLYDSERHLMREDRNWQIVEIIEACPLFDRMSTEIEFMEDHCECISIPREFIHVGVSDVCINEAMMHEKKELYGVQFHPEVSGNMGAILIENFIKRVENPNSPR